MAGVPVSAGRMYEKNQRRQSVVMPAVGVPLQTKIRKMADDLREKRMSRNCWASLIAGKLGDEIESAGIARSSHQAIVQLIIDGVRT